MVPLFRDRHWYDWREVEVEVDDAAGRVAGLQGDQATQPPGREHCWRAAKNFFAPRKGQGRIAGLVGIQRGAQEFMISSACATTRPFNEWPARRLGRRFCG
jgi:hypothetical protein